MRAPVVTKFGFRIRTRQGMVVDLALPGRDPVDAERKLNQIYRECEVIARGTPLAPEQGAGEPELRSLALR